MLRIVVCAENAEEATAWAREHKVPERQAVFASSTRVFEGGIETVVAWLPGFFRRPDAAEFRAGIEACIWRNASKWAWRAGCSGDGV